jgi:hypothetical protein
MVCNNKRVLSLISLVFLSLITAFILLGCAGATETGNPAPGFPQVEGVGDASEFEFMSLCVSGQTYPVQELTDMFSNDITAIRSVSYTEEAGNDAEPDTSITFLPPWAPGSIIVGFDDATAKLVEAGLYTEWDGLNQRFSLKKVNLSSIGYGMAFLEFSARKVHPKYIAGQYKTLAGVEYAEPDYNIGDCSNIYPYIPDYYERGMSFGDLTDTARYYLFRKGDGDCPSGCTINDYWLFTVDEDGIHYMGHYNPDESPEKPEWWGIAQKAINLYRTY